MYDLFFEANRAECPICSSTAVLETAEDTSSQRAALGWLECLADPEHDKVFHELLDRVGGAASGTFVWIQLGIGQGHKGTPA